MDLGWSLPHLMQIVNTSQKIQKDESGRGTKINITCWSIDFYFDILWKLGDSFVQNSIRRFWKFQAFLLEAGVILWFRRNSGAQSQKAKIIARRVSRYVWWVGGTGVWSGDKCALALSSWHTSTLCNSFHSLKGSRTPKRVLSMQINRRKNMKNVKQQVCMPLRSILSWENMETKRY